MGAVASTTPSNVLELARLIAQAGLDPAAPVAPRSNTAIFAGQMVVDVSSMTPDVRTSGLIELGAGAPGFMLAVWIEDMMIRARVAWRAMFGEEWHPIPNSNQADPWVAHKQFLLAVAKLSALDPVTSELVRLRGARAHACRLCRSRRNVSAIDQAGGTELFEDHNPTNITDAQTQALEVVDTFVWQPLNWPSRLGKQIVESLGPTGATELIFDIIRNSANKIAVAFDADAPKVESGVEYYDIDGSSGQLLYNVRPVATSA